eukprot:gene44970-55008_t
MRQDKLTTKFQEALGEAQTLALGSDHAYIEPAHLLLALLSTRTLREALFGISRQFEKIKADDLADKLQSLVGKTGEAGLGATDGSALNSGQPGQAEGAMAPAAMG